MVDMVEDVFFPAKIEKIGHSEEYLELKKRLEELDRKLDLWLSGFDRRLGKFEAKSGAKMGGKNNKLIPKQTAPEKKP